MPDTAADERRSTPVLGSRDQRLVDGQVMLTQATRTLLYGESAPPFPRYREGLRPELEPALPRLVAGARPGLATAMALMRAVANLESRPWDGEDRDEHRILASGAATPLERARLLALLSQMTGIASRICLLYRDREPRFHAVCELGIMGAWALFDPLANQAFLVTHHPYASAWDLMRRPAIVDSHPEHGRKPTIDSSFYRTVGIVAFEPVCREHS
jgi:hypothetical protein